MGQDPAQILRDRNLRVTPQRRAILGAFADRPDEHLAADEVHARATAAVPEIGRGTVYATLAELTELGLLAAYGSPEPVRYESNVGPHDHFRCRLCLRLFDVDVGKPRVSGLAQKGFEVEGVSVLAEGVCAECHDYGRGLRDGTDAVRDRPQLTPEVVGVLACARHEGDLGPVMVGATDDGLVRIAFEEHADFRALGERAATRRGSRASRERVNHVIEAMDAFLGGSHDQFDDLVDWPTIGGMSRDALEATRGIWWNSHRSYEQLGVDVSPYDCGYAMGTNPIPLILPCHRVTRGSLPPEDYVGGSTRRRQLRELEAAG